MRLNATLNKEIKIGFNPSFKKNNLKELKWFSLEYLHLAIKQNVSPFDSIKKVLFNWQRERERGRGRIDVCIIWIFEMMLDVYYFGYDFSDCYPHFYCGKLKHNVSASVFPSLFQVSIVYQWNDSTWEIIFKVWLLIKQGVQELWRSYSNNDIIDFLTYQSEKHHKM